MGSRELVSVIVPTYYRNDRLREAIASVREQTHDPVEIVVVDDSGEGHAEPVVGDDPDVEYVARETNRGVNAAWTLGFRRTSGAYVQFLDDDDRFLARKLERQIDLLTDHEAAGVAYCGIRSPYGEVVLPNPEVQGEILQYALQWGDAYTGTFPCVPSTMLFERDALGAVMPLRESLRGGTDIELKIDLAQRTEFAFVDEPLVVRGDPDDRLGSSWDAVEGKFEILRRYEYLYDQYPERIRRSARSHAHGVAGRNHLRDERWPPRAPLAYARAAYHAPEREERLRYAMQCAAALGGRPLYVAVNRLVERVRDSG